MSKLPKLLSKQEMLEILQKEEYGYLPPPPTAVSFRVEEKKYRSFAAGKATLDTVEAVCQIGEKEFIFPFSVTMPTAPGKHPFFVMINFRPDVPDRYLPSEELVDHGFAILSFCYNDVTRDNGDFTDGLAGVLYPDGKRGPSDAGKISMWAWAAMRVMDYAQTQESLDLSRSVVCGHSRLGKTALLTGAVDERFAFTYSNDSGCSGAALSRNKEGETVADICGRFPYWFCENYYKYADREEEMPFDQHYLLASVAPRYVCVGSAVEDAWADPVKEKECCIAASPAFNNGFVESEGEISFEGDIGYHLRKGAHYFSREDWGRLMEFVKAKSDFKNVIFDFGNVLARFEPVKIAALFTENKEDAKKIAEVVFDRLYFDRLDAGKITDEELKAEACARLPENLRETARKVYDGWIELREQMPGMPELVGDLKKAGKKVFLLSNISINFAENYHKSKWIGELFSKFDGLVFSGPIGMVKPNREIFEYLLKTHQLSPEECLFVDDSDKNIQGAAEVGLRGYLFDGDADKLRKYLGL